MSYLRRRTRALALVPLDFMRMGLVVWLACILVSSVLLVLTALTVKMEFYIKKDVFLDALSRLL